MRVRIVTLALLLVWGACRDLPSGSEALVAPDVEAFADELRARGAEVERAGPIDQPFFSASGIRLVVNGFDIDVYAFASTKEADRVAEGSSLEGTTVRVGGTVYNVLWTGSPHFFQRDNLVVLYVGNHQATLDLLAGILGSQFAGG